jgi:hypothetical protein
MAAGAFSTGAITLSWYPAVESGVIEQSDGLMLWRRLAEDITGTSWTGSLPGNPDKAYLRVVGSGTGQ